MGSAGMDRAEHTPACIVPHGGKVAEDDFEAARAEGRAVFNKDVSRAYFADDSGHLFPESAAGSGDAFSASGDADVLARKAS